MPRTMPITDSQDTLPLHQFLTYRLSRVQAKLNAQASRILRETSGITLTQWRIIAMVGAAGRTRLSDVSRATALDKGLLSRNLKGLTEEGLISAQADDLDHRAQNLTLSERGQAIYERTLPIMRKRQANLQADLSEEELRIFRRVLDKLEIAAEA